MADYIIAIKRELRDSVPEWVERVRQIEGLVVQGNPAKDQRRIRVSAEDKAIETAKHDLGEICLIEEVIAHSPSKT